MAGILRLERAVGTVDGVNVNFSTPTPYESGSLQVFRNGALQDKSTYVIELDPTLGTFEVCIAPLPANPGVAVAAGQPGDLIDVAYRDGLEITGGGADGGVPDLRGAAELVPKIAALDELRPGVIASDDSTVFCPPKVGGEDVSPKTTSANLRPKIASSKEV